MDDMVPGLVGLPVVPRAVVFTQEQCLRLVTKHGYAVLEHLAAKAIMQKAEARATKRKFRGGWTYLRYTQQLKLATVRALKRLGLVEFCCEGHAGTNHVRVSRKGVEFLELVRGEEILA
jgi:hypothetical protein